MEDGVHRGHLLGDAGYPCGRFLLRQLANPQSPQEERYNKSHISTRNCIERAFGVLKKRFGSLGKEMQTNLKNTKATIIAAAILHNLAVRQRVPTPDEDVPLQLELEDPDDPDPIPGAVGNAHGNVERNQIVQNYF